MFLKIQSQQSEKGVTDHDKTAKRKPKIEHYGKIQRKYFVTIFSIPEQTSNKETFLSTMKNENKVMENELIMMIYIFFTIIRNKLIF